MRPGVEICCSVHGRSQKSYTFIDGRILDTALPPDADLDLGTQAGNKLEALIGTHNLDFDLVESFMKLVIGFRDNLMNSVLGRCG